MMLTLDEVRTLLIKRQMKIKVYTKEADLLRDVTECLECLEGCCVVRQNASNRSGIPDLIVCYLGRFIAFELKDNIGKPSTLQLEWARKIQAAGGIHCVCFNTLSVIEALNSVHSAVS